MKLNKAKKKKIFRRGISLALAFVMLLNETYIWNTLDDISISVEKGNNTQLTAYAEETTDPDPEFPHVPADSNKISVSVDRLVKYSQYCQTYSQYHQNDELTITSTFSSDISLSGFEGLGTSGKPFNGSVKIDVSTDITLNLDGPLFNYVYDNVSVSTSNGDPIKISRYYDKSGVDQTTPLLAKYVYRGSADAATWNIKVVSPTDALEHKLAQFGGFIGKMCFDASKNAENGAQLTLNIIMDQESEKNVQGNSGSDTEPVAIKGGNELGDIGLACCHMDRNTTLDLTYSGSRVISEISTDSGDSGSLIGEMEENAALTYNGTQFLASGKEIKTGDGYAGGIVGRNTKGSVTLSTTPYSIQQYMTGTLGAGGVYGYYKPRSTSSSVIFNVSEYNINCQVNGNGYTGGLFGVLDSDKIITISSGTVTSTHSANNESGKCTAYGGLIGQYITDNISRTLSVSSITAVPKKSADTDYFGGGIGQIDTTNPAYVEFSSFTANATGANAMTFGGLVASADKAYVKANGVTIGKSTDRKNYLGGGLVGCLANGVLQISGSNTINDKSSEPESGNEKKVGKIVGYRDNGFVFLDSGASCTTQAAEVDDIGAWGGVLNYPSVLTVDGTAHTVTVAAPTTSYTSIGSTKDFVISALDLQFDTTDFLKFSTPHTDISNSPITLTGGVDLSDTGIYGLTRDNDISNGSMTKCVYSDTFSGGDKTVTFDTGTIYRHKYNGLFGKLNGGTVQNVTFAGKIDVSAKIDTVCVGTAAAQATGNFNASNITVSTDIDHSGSGEMYVGGILGEADSSIGTISVSGCTVNADIKGSNAKAYLGGVIGRISHNADAAKTWDFSNTTLSGEISNSASGKIGGLIADIPGDYSGNSNHRVITLTDITSDGLKVSGSGDEMGGLLGHSWIKTDVNVDSVTVQNNTADSSKKSTVINSSGSAGGMIYRATGKWTVTSLDIKEIVVNSTGDVGMIVNKGFYNSGSNKSAIYLCLPSGYTYNIDAATVTKDGVFDELCAYTAPNEASVLKNGNGVISINTTFKTDGSTASGSYHARTSYGVSANPNSRYYYNLDTLDNSDPAKLMKWGLNQYACSYIKQYFADPFNGGSITSGTYDMTGYSWYPVDLGKSITVNGTFKFYSHEFELSEDKKAAAETENSYDRNNLEGNQHYMMHCGLFRNVATGVTLTVGTTTFRGDVGKLSDGSGALICGKIEGTSATSRATVKVTGSVSLDGIYVHGGDSGYAPLLINKAGSYVNMNISNVSTTSQYTTDSITSAASSLIGDVGSGSGTGISVDFSNIKLDGRTANLTGTNASTYNGQLDTVYGTGSTIFTRATLLNSFRYASGTTGKYTFTWSDDWKETSEGSGVYTHDGKGVTYGKELGYDSTNYPKTGSAPSGKYNSQYPDEEFWYSGEDHTTGKLTDPINYNNTNVGSRYDFTTGFVPYVYEKYDPSENNYQLIVNHGSSTATGCGTYDDPYLLSSGSKLEDFCHWINTGFSNGDKINVPTSNLTYDSTTITIIGGNWCGGSDAIFTYTGSKFSGTVSGNTYTIASDTMRTYLAGAYYQIPDGVDSITIPSTTSLNDFTGIGNLSDITDTFAVFHGVIDGNGERTIVNNTGYPLIASSNGSVIKDVTIEASPTTNITLSGTQKSFDYKNGDGDSNNAAYGAVIGKVFGGDNIIDNVSISLGTSEAKATISLGGSNPHLVPVGGYIGVVINGGVYFRNMKRVDDKGDPLVHGENLFANVTLNSDASVSASNKKWLYVNPIIGRVLNGFAVTESDTYRPFEDGRRTYPDTSVEYWAKNKSTSAVGMVEKADYDANKNNYEIEYVTMQNGTKNYSIADIDMSERGDGLKFNMSGTDDNSNITVSSAQALYIMSLITQCGLGKSTTGEYVQGSYLKPYDNYMSTHRADYTYVGSDSLPSSKPNSAVASPATDAQRAANDYYASSGDVSAGSGTDKIPHLIERYTNKSGGVYPAFDAAGDAYHYFNLILSGSDATFYLPDGYRGLGTLMFGVDRGSNNLDNFKDNVVFINSLNGNSKTVSLNMSLQVYKGDSNYLTLKGDQASFKTGFAFIDCLQSSGTFSDLTIRGNVDYKKYGTDGSVVAYTSDNVGKNADPDPAVSSFVGVPVAGSGSMTFNNINIANEGMDISGMCYVGGFVGVVNIEATLTFTECSADNLKIFAGCAAGGLIGYMRNNKAKVVADFGTAGEGGKTVQGEFGILSIISAFGSDKINEYEGPGAGGLIGYRKTGVTKDIATEENFTITNVIIKNGSRADSGYIGYNKDASTPNTNYIPAGGIIGDGNVSTILNANNVTVENLDIWGAYAGGFVGKLTHTNSKFTITNCEVKSTENVSIKSVYNNGASGGFIGNIDKAVDSVITDSKVNRYTIEGYKNVGGLIGKNLSSAKLSTTNIDIKKDSLIGDNNVGGMIGNLNNGSLVGYNILIKNQSAKKKNGSSFNDNGYIVGTNNTRLIKLAGFSRQGDISSAKMVGNSDSVSAEKYGEGGYVIFADYKDKASGASVNKVFSPINDENNIVGHEAIDNKTKKTVTDYTIIAQHDESGNVTVLESDHGVLNNEESGDNFPVDPRASYKNPYTEKTATRIANTTGIEYSQVTSVEELTAKNKGFYIRSQAEDPRNSTNPKNKYLRNDLKNTNVIKISTTTNYTEAGVGIWFFKKAGGQYKIYKKEEENGVLVEKYLKTYNGGWMFDTESNATLFTASYYDIVYDTNKTTQRASCVFEFAIDDDYSLSYSGGGTGYKNDNNNKIAKDDTTGKYYCTGGTSNQRLNRLLTIYYAPYAGGFDASEFSDGNVDYEDGDTTIGTTGGTSITDASDLAAYRTEYDDALDAYETAHGITIEDRDSYEVWKIKKTFVENSYSDAQNSSPYVTTNPKGLINSYTHDKTVDGETVSVTDEQWLTGDGVSSGVKTSSAFDAIIADQVNNSNKAYAFCDQLGAEENASRLDNVNAEISNSVTEYKSYFSDDTTIENFPLFLAENTNSTELTKVINDYLQTLTNTKYNFADPETNSGVFNTVISTYTYNESAHEFRKTELATGPNLNRSKTEKKFSMNANRVDTGSVPQFTLLDIQFKDPTGETDKIAYHLYVPVYVKKILRFDFRAQIKTGTDYYTGAYDKLSQGIPAQGLFENLGNPVTIAFEFDYDRTEQEWIDAVNSGDSLLTNYYKTLTLKNHTENNWAPGTKMILVDANTKSVNGTSSKDKYYYLDTPPIGNTPIRLYDFTDGENGGGNHYKPACFQDLMGTITVTQQVNNIDGTLVPTAGNTSVGATVYDGTTYYRPINADDDPSSFEATYLVTSIEQLPVERYYLTILTKAQSSEEVFRYEISCPDEFINNDPSKTMDDKSLDGWRSNRVEDKTVINFFTGKLFEVSDEQLTLNVKSPNNDDEMTASNRFLTITMNSKVELTESAVNTYHIDSSMKTFSEYARVYQTFLMMYDKHVSEDAVHEMGIDLDAKGAIGEDIEYYYAPGKHSTLTSSTTGVKEVSDAGSKASVSENYVELRNEVNLIPLLAESQAATLQVKFNMVYAPDYLSTQFPKRAEMTEGETYTGTIGSYVIGYSRIGSTIQSVANSATSIKRSDNTLYYTADDMTAILKYNVDRKTGLPPAGPYSDLGINAVEQLDGDTLEVHTTAIYDTHKLTNAGDYIELTLTLSNKRSYVTPTIGAPTNSGTPLTIEDYITDLKIFGDLDKDGVLDSGNTDVIFDQSLSSITTGEDRRTENSSTIYKVRVKKDLLQTQADDYYYIPITFKVKTGNATFRAIGGYYSNYKVSLTASLYSDISSSSSAYYKPSYAFDHIIYTNARVLPQVVE